MLTISRGVSGSLQYGDATSQSEVLIVAKNEMSKEDEGAMSRTQVGIQVSGLALIILILGTGFLLMAPLSPRITVTVAIERPMPKLSILLGNYEKIPVGTALAATRDTPLLTVLSGTVGHYTLDFHVNYRETKLSNASFSALGEGTYQIKVTYLRTPDETKGTPYVVMLTLWEDGIKQQESRIDIFPV